MPKRLYILLFMLSSAVHGIAQKGFIRGSLIDDATGEALIGVAVQIEELGIGSISDLDGKFEIRVEEGTYNLVISYVSYKTLTVSGIIVKAEEAVILETIRMKEDIAELQEVVVTAKVLASSEEALLTIKRKSVNVMDGISSANFKKIGDSDAAAAIKRVPGVSVEGGKYVFVRGLGDRYTKSTLNGVDVPGLDPDRNTVQMDLFPTNLLDNIVVLKSFTSDLPGDFTGGIVNIETKDFPEERLLNLSASVGYNPSMHFNTNYLTYQGGKYDWLGKDDGTRAIPTDNRTDIPLYPQVVGKPDSPAGQEFQSILSGFNSTMSTMRTQSAMDYSMAFSLGNQHTIAKNTFGYSLALSYSNNTEYYEGAEFGRYGKSDPNVYDLEQREFQVGDYGLNNVSLSGLAGLAWKRDKSKIRLNLFHTQNGESKAGVFDFQKTDLGATFEATQHNLEYSERQLSNILLNGVHFLPDPTWQIEWKVSPTRSKIEDPDIRFTRYRNDGGISIGSESGYPERIWRYLDEINIVGKADITKTYSLFLRDAKLKFGGGYTYKERDYEIQGFQFIPQNVPLIGNPDEIFYQENLWPMDGIGFEGTRYEPQFIPVNPNKYSGTINNIAAYASTDFNISERTKASIGLRVEDYSQYYTGVNRQGLKYNDQLVVDDFGFFPALNLIFAVTEKQNLRFSFASTVARPSFKEASFAEIRDPLTGRTFIGGFFTDRDDQGNIIWDGKLVSTQINNFDLRWETFQSKGQTLALSAYYKTFDNPIEIVQFVQAPNNFQPRNVGSGSVLGLELEARQNLGTVGSWLSAFSASGNMTFAKSKIEMSPTEYNSRVTNAREGEVISSTRDMAGQAPYIINVGLSYQGKANGLEAGLFYNVQGETLTFVGIADRPDVYSVPFNSLNFNALKSIGQDERMQISFGINNILGSERLQVFKSYESVDKTFVRLNPGTSATIKFNYKF